MAELGPVPHTPETGKVVSFRLGHPASPENVASGVSMIIDVEFGPGGELYSLSQGDSEGVIRGRRRFRTPGDSCG